MRVTRIPLSESETLAVLRSVNGEARIGVERINRPEGVGGIDQVYSLDNAQREQLREALR